MEKSFDYPDIPKNGERKVFFSPKGLDEEEQKLVERVGEEVIRRSEEKFKYALSRCTFFAEPGLEVLEEIAAETPELTNPEIRGCDKNPFDQHYWVEVTLKKSSKRIIIDPIFGYVGVFDSKTGYLEGEEYYKKSRHVIPDVHVSEGGVRINTNGVM